MKIYVGIPYTGCEQESFDLANKVAAKLMNEGHIIFSPISQSHPIAMANDLPKGWDFWKKFDESFLEWCDCLMIVVMKNNGIERIKNSTGLQAEYKIANELNKIIDYIKEEDI